MGQIWLSDVVFEYMRKKSNARRPYLSYFLQFSESDCFFLRNKIEKITQRRLNETNYRQTEHGLFSIPTI